MASRRRGSAFGGLFGKVIWFIAMASLIFAFYKVPVAGSPEGLWEILKAKSESVENWVNSWAGDVPVDTPDATEPVAPSVAPPVAPTVG